jgi:hypothetical protein
VGTWRLSSPKIAAHNSETAHEPSGKPSEFAREPDHNPRAGDRIR